ncbi:DUF6705 family protein [Winogradskyella forsetii]|uniref:DUF6705 family protein n=1 Tax=Winogradskyella forsetii TaxID=2686077 RepID=UPI0015BFB87B|nr:DUF6705 family protein [Winogradskyella forsetii]
MKNIVLVLITLITFYSCKAQTIYPLGTPREQITENNFYIKDIENIHDQVVGVWRWESGNSSFEITLQEFEQSPGFEGSTFFKDVIHGKYKYIEDGNIIAEVIEIPNLIQNRPKVYVGYESENTFFIQISDIISEKYKQGTFIINDDGTATISLQDPIGTSGIRTPNDPPPNNLEFQLPTNITLTKEE